MKWASVNAIVIETADYFNLKPDDLYGRRRTKSIARARQVAMYLARRHTELPLEEIGFRLGGRDHTTVMWGVGQVERFVGLDPDFARQVDVLAKTVETQQAMERKEEALDAAETRTL